MAAARRRRANAGITLTESFAMYPTAAVSGWYFSHPGCALLRGRQDRPRPGAELRRAQEDLAGGGAALAVAEPRLRLGFGRRRGVRAPHENASTTAGLARRWKRFRGTRRRIPLCPTCRYNSGSMTISKVYPSAQAALADVVRDGMTVMCGGFGLCGIPENLILALCDSGVHGLTVVSNNAGVDQFGLGKLLKTRQIAQDDFFLRRREQGVRAAVSGGRAAAGVQSAGHACRAHPRRRRGHLRLLHQDRRGHAGRRRQGDSGS